MNRLFQRIRKARSRHGRELRGPNSQYGMWTSACFFAFFLAIMVVAAHAHAATFDNPITSKTFAELIAKISQSIRNIALVIAPVFLIITGFRFVVAASTGNEAGITTAKKHFYWTLIGTAIVVGASVITTAIINFVSGL